MSVDYDYGTPYNMVMARSGGGGGEEYYDSDLDFDEVPVMAMAESEVSPVQASPLYPTASRRTTTPAPRAYFPETWLWTIVTHM